MGSRRAHRARLCSPTRCERRTTHQQLSSLLSFPQGASHDVDTVYVTQVTKQVKCCAGRLKIYASWLNLLREWRRLVRRVFFLSCCHGTLGTCCRGPDAKRRKDVWSTPRRRQRGSRIGLHFSCIANTIAIISWVVRSSLNLCGVYCSAPYRNVEALFGDLEGPRRPLKTGKVCCKSTSTGCNRVVKSGNGRFTGLA